MFGKQTLFEKFERCKKGTIRKLKKIIKLNHILKMTFLCLVGCEY